MTTEEQVTKEPKPSLLKRQIGGSGKAKDTAPKTGKYNIPPRPQVNLMPPEIIEGRNLLVLRRRLIWAIIALLVVVVLAFGAAYLMRMSAQQRYDTSLAQADTLTAQKRQYSPVIQVQSDITKTTTARTYALSTEVDWTVYAYAIQAALPAGVKVETMQVAGISPGEELAAGSDPLTQAGIAVISFSALSDTLPDASAWIEALQSIPGLVDANLQSSVLSDTDGKVTYVVTSTVQVTEEALANRTFADPSSTPSPTASPAADGS